MNHRNLLTDNPALYETRFPDPERLAGRWTEDRLRGHGCGARVLDIGCGTGRDAAHLHAAGRTVTGADLSDAMLRYAARHHPGPRYVHADLRRFDLGAGNFDAVVCLDSALLYCRTDAELDSCLASCHRALAPGGLLVAEMRNGAYFLDGAGTLGGPAVHTFTHDGVTYRSVTRLRVDAAPRLLHRSRTWTTDDGSPPVEQRSAWRLLPPPELRRAVTAAGFEVLALHDGPGPRTEPAWREGATPAGTTTGDRLHLIARRTAPHA
ncbi:class I SAM-dependent methyltransferase [Streptomyces sp. NBC_00525]|uniref:class I SAM-dependent methyltransferase n=1 Tax=Streptomyces sp. NBC_00525 TaxID=2903660 RepID=UPI002E7FCD86|nr:class I SAM-dependent methyltransferase [Streptomyces sp. NBC_00525]WUC97379.1 class I SAM-dependent methyltransferase [Streptomyces sp. NBC_00525]